VNTNAIVYSLRSPVVSRRQLLVGSMVAGAAIGGARFTGAPSAAAQATPEAADPGEYLANATDFVDTANWDNQQEIVVELNELSFTPNDLTFEAGTPYVLILRNVGKEKHCFTAHEFYRAIATRKAETPESEVKVPYFTAIEVYPRMEAELLFIPVMPGTYEFFCEIEGHAKAGMTGTITVTGEAMTEPAPVLAQIADGDWVLDGADRVSAADWDAMETVTVELGDYLFKPNVILLQVDQPYKIEIKNGGVEKHEFTAGDFYRSVALRKVQDASGEYKGPYLREVEVFAAQQTDLYLIPTVAGVFDLVCEIEGHLEKGMFGKIIVKSGE
jgi:uncharacterized cupredoxin-like copper-binding protein